MIELFGNNEEVIKDYIKHDRLSSFIDDITHSKISEISLENAKKAYKWSKSQGLNEEQVKNYISKYCEIIESNSLDTNAYSDIRFPSNVINLYNIRLNELYISLKLSDIIYARFVDIFLLHEFYHYIENYKLTDLQSISVNTYGLGKWKLQANVDAVSEISATLFVREVVGDVRGFLGIKEGD